MLKFLENYLIELKKEIKVIEKNLREEQEADDALGELSTRLLEGADSANAEEEVGIGSSSKSSSRRG